MSEKIRNNIIKVLFLLTVSRQRQKNNCNGTEHVMKVYMHQRCCKNTMGWAQCIQFRDTEHPEIHAQDNSFYVCFLDKKYLFDPTHVSDNVYDRCLTHLGLTD